MEHTERVCVYEPCGAVVEEFKGPSLALCHTANEISIGQICCRSCVVHKANRTSNLTLRGLRKPPYSPGPRVRYLASANTGRAVMPRVAHLAAGGCRA